MRLGLAGWVKNEPDGSVRLVAWGPTIQLRAFEAELGKGPMGARVDAVERLNDPAPPAPEAFSIER